MSSNTKADFVKFKTLLENRGIPLESLLRPAVEEAERKFIKAQPDTYGGSLHSDNNGASGRPELKRRKLLQEVKDLTGKSKENYDTEKEKSGNTSTEFFKNLRRNLGDLEVATAIYYWFHVRANDSQYACIIDYALYGGTKTFEKEIGKPVPGKYYEDSEKRPLIRFSYPALPSDNIQNENPFCPGYIKYYGRGEEQQLLDEFITINKNEANISLWAVSGPSGSGKTSLVQHWMTNSEVMPEDQWEQLVLGNNFAKSHGHSRAFWEGTPENPDSGWLPTYNTLIVIDYLHVYREALDAIIRRCGDLHSQGKLQHSIRILLIDHVFPENLNNITTCERLRSTQENTLDIWTLCFDTKPLSLAATHGKNLRNTVDNRGLKEIIPSILSDAAGDNVSQNVKDKALRYLADTKSAYYPLFAILLGYTLKQNPNTDFLTWNRRQLIEQYFKNKRLPWLQLKPSDEYEKELWQHRLWAAMCVVVSTLRRGMTWPLLLSCMPDNDNAPTLDHPMLKAFSKSFISTSDAAMELPAFEPDILGETYTLLFLKSLLDGNKNLRQLRQPFFEMLCADDDILKQKDATEFIGTISRMTRNLCNDNQQDKEVQAHWKALIGFLDARKLSATSSMKWAFSASLVDLADQLRHSFISSEDDKQEPPKHNDFLLNFNTALAQIDRATLYAPYEETEGVLYACLRYAMQHIECLHKAIYFRGKDTLEVEWHNLISLFKKFDDIWQSAKIIPLHIVAEHGHSYIVRRLVDEGADINHKDQRGWTATGKAAQNGHLEVVRQLVFR